MSTAAIRDYYIKSVFYGDYNGRVVVKRNPACHAETAVLRSVDHMRHDRYGAVLVEVYDEVTGKVHAVIKRNLTGKSISILYSSVKVKED